MNVTARKHPRTLARGNGHLLPGMSVPLSSRELWPGKEPIHLRDPLQTLLSEWVGAPTAAHPWSPAFGLPAFYGVVPQEMAWTPPINVQETENELILECYIPGVSRADIQVEVKNGTTLVVKGERKLEREKLKEEPYLRKEFLFREFYRAFALPFEVKPEGIQAEYEDGILEVCLPKRQEARKGNYRVTVQG